MIKLAIGLLFVLINFAPEIGDLSINLLPEFVGYLFILSAVDKLRTKSPYFANISGLLFIMIIYKIVDYICLMINLNSGIGATIFFYSGIAATAAGLFIQYRVFCGIDEIAYNDDVRVNTGRIFLLFKFEVVLAALAYINDLYRIYLDYAGTGEIIPGLSHPLFSFFSAFPESVLDSISTIGTVIILSGVVIRVLMIIFSFEVCADYDKITTKRADSKTN